MRSTTRCILLVGIVLMIGGTVAISPISSTSAQQSAQNHTLIIVTTNSTATYSVTVSQSLSPVKPEKQDRVTRGFRMAGSVGTVDKVLDLHDEVHYSGHIKSFNHQGEIRMRLDGKDVDPAVVAGQHIEIAYPTNSSRSQPIRYQVSVSNATTTGEQTEGNDTASGSTIQGQISRSDSVDAFYFTGDISNQSWGNATVRINGQPARKFIESDAPTPPTTAQNGGLPDENPETTSTGDMGADTGPQESQQDSGSGFFNSAFLIGLVGGFVVLIVAGVVMLLYIDHSAR